MDHGDARGGVLRVALGGHDDADIVGLSAGWRRDFKLQHDSDGVVNFDYSLSQNANYESDEWGQVLVSIDGQTVGRGGQEYVDRLIGDGNGGSRQSTGWRTVQLDLGRLDAGTHSLTVGGYNQKKTYHDETTKILLDNVQLVAERTTIATPPPTVVPASTPVVSPVPAPTNFSPTPAIGQTTLYQSLDELFARLGQQIAPATSVPIATMASIPFALVPARDFGSTANRWLADQYFRTLDTTVTPFVT